MKLSEVIENIVKDFVLNIQIKIQSEQYRNILITKLFIKYQSNVAKYRNYLTTVRCDDSYSSLYKIHEDVFINLGKGEGSGDDKEAIYKLDGAKANLMMNFNTARNNMMLLSKGNFDEHGNTTLRDYQNRPKHLEFAA